jgi:PAS domain S-box-containing protein
MSSSDAFPSDGSSADGSSADGFPKDSPSRDSSSRDSSSGEPEQPGTDHPKPEKSRAEKAQAEKAHAEQAQSEQAQDEQSQPEQSQPERSQPDRARLRALRRYDVLGTEPEPNFDRITRVAASLFEVPIAMINFLAAGREWRKSAVGIESGIESRIESGGQSPERSPEPSFCREAVQSGGTAVIEDVAEAERFAGHPLVEGPPGVRFYAGAPLQTPGGHRIGTLCVLGEAPRSVSDQEAARLEDLAEMVMSELERRRETKERIQRKDRWLQSVAENVSEGIYRTVPGDGLTDANEAFAEMFGYDSAQEVLEADPRELYADPTERPQVLQKTDRQGGLDGEVIEFRRAGGSTFTGRVTDTAVRGEDGEVAYYGGVVTDITERQRREKQLRQQKNLLEQTQRLAGAWEADLESGETSWSEKIYEIHEMDPEAPVDLEKGLEFYLPEARDMIREATRALTEEGESYDLELPIETAEGSRRWVRVVGAPTEQENGEVVKVAGALQDITERKEAQRGLERMAEAIEVASDGIALLNDDGIYTYVNQSHAEIYGYDSPEPLLGSSWRKCYRSAEIGRFEETIMPRLREEGTWRGDATGQRKDGTVFPQAITLTLLGDGGIVCVVRDITERERREEELRESRRELRREQKRIQSITENVSDGIYRSTEEEGIIYANQAFVEMLGYESLQALKEADSSGFYADPARREELIEKEAEEGGLAREEVRYCRKDGTTFIGLLSTERVGGEEEEKTYFDGAITDITERREARQRLERQKEYTDRLLGAIDDLFFVFDGEARLQRWNGRVPEVTGYSEEELGGMEALDFVPEGERERVAARIADGFTAGRAQMELPLLCKDGTTIPYEIVGNLVEHPEGGIRVVGIGRDITERRRREETLERQNDLFERAQEIASVGAWEYDVQAGELTLTDQAYRVHGLPPGAEMTPQRSHGLYHPEDRPEAEEAFRRAIEEGKSYDIEARLITEQGEEKWVRSRGQPQREGEEVARVRGAIQDITEQKRREQALREAKEEAEQAKEEAEKARREAEEARRMQSAFLANMSHEIRTPLTSIIGFAEALGAESAELELPEGSALPKYASLIEKGGKRLLQTLEGVLNLSKLEAGQMELSEEPVDLAAQAHRAAEELGPDAQEKGIDLRLETREAGARADEGGVQIVLRNLLSNAIKYTGEGGRIWVRTYQEEDAARSENAAVLEVEDTGIGMEPGVAEDLFEPFRQASEGWGREYEGTGVGLAVTREATEQMGGTIEVETEEGEGSRFVVRLPQAGDAGSREAD